MSMIEDLRGLGIMNVYQLGGRWQAAHPGAGRPPAIVYRPGAAGSSTAWQVYRGDGVRTDPAETGVTLDHGRKTFGIYGPVRRMKGPALEEAEAWVNARYRTTDWAKHPGGRQLGEAWYPADVIAWLMDELARARIEGQGERSPA